MGKNCHVEEELVRENGLLEFKIRELKKSNQLYLDALREINAVIQNTSYNDKYKAIKVKNLTEELIQYWKRT